MKKNISAILALSLNEVYGQDGSMLWRIPEDFAHFKKLTLGTTVIMGRLTWESLPTKNRPLPGRENIVVSRNREFLAEGAIVVSSFEQAVAMALYPKIFAIGGHAIWSQAMEVAQEVWITVIKKRYSIIPGATLVAENFLRVQEQWPEFQLHENPSYKSLGPEALEFEIQQWVRKAD